MSSPHSISVQDSAVKKTHHLLMIDDNTVILDSMVKYLENYPIEGLTLEIELAYDSPQAREKIANKTFDLIITDIGLPTEDGFKVVDYILEVSPTSKIALITAFHVEDYMKVAKQHGVNNILPKTAPFNFQELTHLIRNALIPEQAFGLEKYVGTQESEKSTSDFQQFEIQNSDAIMEAFYLLRQFFEAQGARHVDDLSTAMIEALTNSVYHVAKNPDGSLKYQKGQEIPALLPEEFVTVTYGRDAEKLGVSIVDQGGRITTDEVMYWLERNISGSGLLDTHGRGVYLIYTLVDRLIINIAPGKKTEMIMLHYFNPDYSSNKPLYINQVTSS
jgi:DNA-binding response OmpR family regulator